MIKISNKTDRYHQVSHAVIYNIQVNRSSLLAEIITNKLRWGVHLPNSKKKTRKQRWLRTFLLQQCYPFLAQLVLPRLLAPDLPWTCYSRLGLKVSHSNQLLEAVVDTDSHLFRHCLFEKFSLLLPTLAVNAVSHAFSPEPNPNSPLSVKATVVQYTTVNSW